VAAVTDLASAHLVRILVIEIGSKYGNQSTGGQEPDGSIVSQM
jgi:hypothetical protein